MSTILEARNAIMQVVSDGWAADPLTQNLTLLWDDVQGDAPGHDANGEPVSYGRCTVRHLLGGEETIGGEGLGKDLQQGQVVVQVFTPKGHGYLTADPIVQVVKRFFQRQRFGGDGYFFEVTASEIPSATDWVQVNVVAQFRYEERIP